MHQSTLIRFAALALLALVAGCNLPRWQPGGSTYTSQSGDFTVRVPAGWMFIEAKPGNVVSTVDGTLLQRAAVGRHELKEPLAFSKRTLTRGMNALDLAEAIADDMRADHGFQELKVPKIEPATIAGHDGCHLVLQFHTAGGLRMTEDIYAFTAGDSLYEIFFAAPTRYYYERDVAGFQELVQSVQLTKS